ncbi:MAG: 23S rRNA (guanosine(2251)-2'-O)-methyltransferase RlmB [Deltaproteobacteria bacterium]|nr:23S rRNA (guanosine(2251)-2'-O)-methyltransferase RlmB [Deltaproteobacteria bacterium]
MAAESPRLVVGRHAVAAALAGDPASLGELLVAQGERSGALRKLEETARAQGVKVRRVPLARLTELCPDGTVHQGVGLILAAAPAYTDLAELLSRTQAAGEAALVLVADHVQDPHNLGAMIRSAAAVGAQGVVIPRDRACPLTPAVAKAAAGALPGLPVCRVTNLTQALEEMKAAGLWALAAATRGGPPPWELDLRMPLALVVGGEHKGVSPRLLGACDFTASLPLAPGVESLNASVAAGILLFEALRQRRVV